MHQLEMDINRPYKNVCDFFSKSIHVYGLIKDGKVSLAGNKDISVLMDIIVINVLDACHMLLSKKWCELVCDQL